MKLSFDVQWRRQHVFICLTSQVALLLETKRGLFSLPPPNSSLFRVIQRLSYCVMFLVILHREMDAKDKWALEEEIVRKAGERKEEEEPCTRL